MRAFIVVMMVSLLAGCGFSGQPKEHPVENARSYSMPKAAVWQDLTTWFAKQPAMIVRKSDEAMGQIIAEITYPLNGGPADCGFDDSQPPIERRGEINVSVVPTDANNTSVTARAAFREYRDDKWVSGGTVIFECTSTGGLERQILDAVN